jgi:chemotaxis protein CheD
MSETTNLYRVLLHSGEHYATNEDLVISTLLGSCVAACLYDPVAHVSGMNHFMLANRRYAKNLPICATEAGRYGEEAMELLLGDMCRLGAVKTRVRAKAFGGGDVLNTISKDNFFCVGEVNVRFIREFLKMEGIPLDAEDLGGKQGRVIRFRTDNYAVHRKYIVTGATEKIEKKEHGYWEKEIQNHERKKDYVLSFS